MPGALEAGGWSVRVRIPEKGGSGKRGGGILSLGTYAAKVDEEFSRSMKQVPLANIVGLTREVGTQWHEWAQSGVGPNWSGLVALLLFRNRNQEKRLAGRLSR
jgi:hypothetical protein